MCKSFDALISGTSAPSNLVALLFAKCDFIAAKGFPRGSNRFNCLHCEEHQTHEDSSLIDYNVLQRPQDRTDSRLTSLLLMEAEVATREDH